MQVKIIVSSCKRKMQLLFLCENWIPFFPDIEMRKNWTSNKEKGDKHMSKSFKECAVEIAKEAAWAGFVVAATTAVELTLSEIRNNSQDDDDDEDDDEYY